MKLRIFQVFVIIHLYCFKCVGKQGTCVCEVLFIALVWDILHLLV